MTLIRAASILLSFTLVLSLCACGKKTEKPSTAPAAESSREQAPEPEPEKVEVVKEFNYTESPTLDMIPNAPVQGKVNGMEFKPQTILIEPFFEQWGIKLFEKLPEDNVLEWAGLGDDGMTLEIEFTEKPAQGKVISMPMEKQYTQVTYFTDPDRANEQNWSAPSACVIEFTEWQAEPYTEDIGMGFAQAGTASGRIALCARADSEGNGKSWVAGTFKDVPVIYRGKPGWLVE